MDIESINLTKIKKQLQKELDVKRYEHTMGVAYTAAALAMRYDEDVNKALIAGLLHDCAKCYDDEKKFALCKKYSVKLSNYEKENTSLIHAKLGAALAKEKYDISDKDVINAIKWHTTGKADMNLLEKIVFSADYIEPGRKMILGLEEIRSVIFTDLDKAIYLILKNTIRHLENKSLPIDDKSQEAYLFYKELHKGRDNQV